MRWSVLLPTHDRPDTLALAIESVLAQHDRDLELLIASSVLSPQVVDVLRGADPRVKVFDLPEQHGAHGSRTALAAASGRYLAVLDETDLWSPRHLSELGARLDAGHALAHSRPVVATSSGYLVPLAIDLRDRLALERLTAGERIPTPVLAFSMSAVRAAGGWPVDAPTDAEQTLLRRVLAGRGATVGYVPTVTALSFGDVSRAHAGDWWPAAAMLTGGEGTPQARVVRAAASLPDRWWAGLSDAAETIQAHLAGETARFAAQNTELTTRLAAAEARIEQLDAAFREVPAWRVPTRLRETFEA